MNRGLCGTEVKSGFNTCSSCGAAYRVQVPLGLFLLYLSLMASGIFFFLFGVNVVTVVLPIALASLCVMRFFTRRWRRAGAA